MAMSSSEGRREHSVHHIAVGCEENPYHRPSFTVNNRLARLLWHMVYVLLYRMSPNPAHVWRSMLLRLFGAKIGKGCHFYPGGKVWAPWNLTCEDCCTLADGAEIYNPSPGLSGESLHSFAAGISLWGDTRLQPSRFSNDLLQYEAGRVFMDLRPSVGCAGRQCGRRSCAGVGIGGEPRPGTVDSI